MQSASLDRLTTIKIINMIIIMTIVIITLLALQGAGLDRCLTHHQNHHIDWIGASYNLDNVTHPCESHPFPPVFNAT